jgi:hypothetical protein
MSLTPYEKQQLYIKAAELLQQGYTENQIADELGKQGISEDDTKIVIDRLASANLSVQELQGKGKNAYSNSTPITARKREPTYQPNHSAALQAMAVGGVICIIGLIVSIGSFSAASRGGGRYVVAYGAVIGGGLQFFRGLFAYLND